MKAIIAIIIGVAVFIFGVTWYLGPNDFRSCDDASGPTGDMSCSSADAIVAVSGGDTTARTTQAIKLYQAGWAPKLIFSGAAKDKTGPSNAAAMRTQAIAAGVSDGDIIVEEFGATTAENAELTQQIVQDNGIKSVILVTSAYHQRRAELEFQKRAGEGVIIRNHPAKDDRQWSVVWWLTPSGWVLAVGELIKIGAFYAGR